MVKEQFRDKDSNYRISTVHFTISSAEETTRQSQLRVIAKHLYLQDTQRTPVLHGVLDRRMGTSSKAASCTTCSKGLLECTGHFGYVELELPVFHCGYFGNILNILQCICKSCAALLLGPADREAFGKIVSKTNLSYLMKKALKKKIIVKAKKMHTCQVCGEFNGVVKKCGVLKIAHDKYRYAKNSIRLRDYKADFESATSQRYTQLDPTVEVLNPLVVRNLFQRISLEDLPYLLMGSSGFSGPTDLVISKIPVPPVCIRPSVVSEIKSGTTEDDITMKLAEICFLNDGLAIHRENGVKVEMFVESWDMIQQHCALLINSEMNVPNQGGIGKKKAGRGFVQRLKGKQGRFRGNLSGKRVDFSGRSVISPDPNLMIQQVGVPEQMAKILTYPERVTPHNVKWLRKLVVNGPNTHPGANFIEGKDGFRKYLQYGDKIKFAQELKPGDIVERHCCDGDVVLFNRQPSLHRLSIMCHIAKIVPGKTLRFNECVCAPYNADFDGDEMNIHLPQTEEAKAEALILMANQANLCTPRNGELIISATQDFLTGAYLLTNKNNFYYAYEVMRMLAYVSANLDEYIELPPPAIVKPIAQWTGKQIISLIFRPNKNSPIKFNLRTKGKCYTGNAEEMSVEDTFCVIHNSELMAGALDKSTLGGSKTNVFYALLKDWGKEASCLAMYRLSRLTSHFLMNRGFSIGIGDVTPGLKLLTEKKRLITEGYDKCQKMLSAPSETLDSSESFVVKELSDIRDEAGKLCVQELHPTNAPLIMAKCGSKGSNINISQMIACVGQQVINGKRVSEGFYQRGLPHFKRKDRSPEAKGFVANSFFSGLTPTEFYFHAMGGREGLVDTAVKTAETGYMQRRLVKALEDLCCQYDMSVRNAEGHVIQLSYGQDGLDPLYMEGKDKPVDFFRVYLNVKAHYPSRQDTYLSKQSKLDVLTECAKMCSKLSVEDPLCNEEFVNDMEEFVVKHPFRHEQLMNFCEDCWEKYFRARMEPGTAVGALAAQSIGEPGTQMTLKTFHFAGVASMNITLGVPRIKEIINAAKSISTPIIEARLIEEDPKLGLQVKNYLQRTLLREVCTHMNMVFTPDDYFILVNLNQKAMDKRGVSIYSLIQYLGEALKFKNVNAVSILDPGIIRITPPTSNKSTAFFVMHNLIKILPSTPIKGVKGINRVILQKETSGNFKIFADGQNFAGVLATYGVCHKRTSTNNIFQVQNVLGIEAARQSIIKEIQYTMESHGMSVDRRHLMLVADLMTCRGEVLGITRHGLAKMKESVLMLASFERTADHLFEAAYHGQKDIISGVSDSIIMGIPMALGTGCMQILEKPPSYPPLESRPLLFEGVLAEQETQVRLTKNDQS